MDMGSKKISTNPSNLLLGRHFLSIAKTEINIQNDTLAMEFDGEIAESNVFGAIKHYDDLFKGSNMDFVDSFIQPCIK